jgi:hypothetical protein
MSTSPSESRSCDTGYKMDIILHEGQHWFRAADATRHLGYSNGRQAVINFVKQKDRTTREFLVEGCGDHSVYINETGMRALIRRSRKPEADDLEAWVALKLDELRGAARGPRKPHAKLQICLVNEFDLHAKVIDFVRRFHPEANIVAGLGENQDSEEKRIKSWQMGYTRGQCDILLLNRHKKWTGMAIELKSPTGFGVVSPDQQKFLVRLEKEGYKTLISNDYDEVVVQIMEYFRGLQ